LDVTVALLLGQSSLVKAGEGHSLHHRDDTTVLAGWRHSSSYKTQRISEPISWSFDATQP